MESNMNYEFSDRRNETGSARAVVVAVIAVVLFGVIVALVLTRGIGRSTSAGRPVPAPATDPFATASSGAAPRPGEIVLTLPPDKIENAQLKIEEAHAASEANSETAALRTTGIVQADAYRETPVMPVVTGIVRQVNAELGDRVRTGQVLATVFSNELAETQSAYLSMQAEAERHHKHYERTAELVELGAASREELEQATAEAKTEAAKLSAMREKLTLLGLSAKQIEGLRWPEQVKSVVPITAPASGTIVARNVNPGEVMMAAKEMFRVVDLSEVWVIGQIYERDFASVRIGTPASITSTAYPDKVLRGRVSYIDPRVDPQTRTAQVRVEVPNRGEILRLGMFVDVNFGSSTQTQAGARSVMVPRSAIQMIGSRQVAFVAGNQPGTFIQRDVGTGAERDGMVPVFSGVTSGERVVTEGSFLLRAESLKQDPNQAAGAREANPAAPAATERSQAGPAASSPAARRRGEVSVQTATIRITSGGFEPATIRLRKGVSAQLTFVREIDPSCATEIVIPEFKIKRGLPLNEHVTVEFTPSKAGEFGFSCGMNMLQGRIIVR
jgi:RND family efflux transporter MFP subunit